MTNQSKRVASVLCKHVHVVYIKNCNGVICSNIQQSMTAKCATSLKCDLSHSNQIHVVVFHVWIIVLTINGGLNMTAFVEVCKHLHV